jgi:hypothetical protein
MTASHPRPWRVEYSQTFPEWHDKSQPVVRDDLGRLVCKMMQHVGHPGYYDELADKTAHMIVASANFMTQEEIDKAWEERK